MMHFKISKIRKSTPFDLYGKRNNIYMDANYQLPSESWNADKQRLFIDSMLNGFDLPKLYLRRFHSAAQFDGRFYDYAMLEGKEAALATFSFIRGHLELAEDFEYRRDREVRAGGMNYARLCENYPYVKLKFDSYEFDIVEFTAYGKEDDVTKDLILHFFARHQRFANAAISTSSSRVDVT